MTTTGAGEAPGVWMGSGAKQLGLVDTVDPAVLRELLAGRHPVSGEQLARPVRRPDPRGQVDARPLLRLLGDHEGDGGVSPVGQGWAQRTLRQAARTGRLPVESVRRLAEHADLDVDALRDVYPGGVLEAAGRHAGKTVDRRVPGFDLTFRPAKSVSILWVVGEPEVRCEVAAAHDAAVAAALAYVEQEAGWCRRGHAGAEAVRIEGFVAAAFRHRTARPVTLDVGGEQVQVQDPLLHTHVVVANLARATDDGRWRALDGTAIYRHAKTAGTLYQAHLRSELSRRLGVEWGPISNGCADLAGIPRPVIDAFSLRRGQILQVMRRMGTSSAKAAEAATLSTRQAKPTHEVGEGLLHAGWAGRAAGMGFTASTPPTSSTDTNRQSSRRRRRGGSSPSCSASTGSRRPRARSHCGRWCRGGRSVRAPRPQERRIVPWTAEQVAAVIAAHPPEYRAVPVVAAGAGLRQGEVFGLRVDDVAFLRHRLHVRQQVKLVGGGGPFLAAPKRGKLRDVPLADAVAEAVAERLREWPAGEQALVFTERDGGLVNRDRYNRDVWKPALRAAGIEPSREHGMHALRHYYASVLLDAGESVRALAAYLGHEDPGFTLRTYTHLMPTSEDRARRAVDAALASASVPSGASSTSPR